MSCTLRDSRHSDNNEWGDVITDQVFSLQFPFTFPRNFSLSLSPYLIVLSANLSDFNESGDRCMTSASELFSTRRSRPGRSDPDLESDSSLHRHHSHHHHHHNHRRHGIHNHNHRHDSDGCDPLRRAPPRLRRFCHLTVSFFVPKFVVSVVTKIFCLIC